MSGKILRANIVSYMGLRDLSFNWDEHSILGVLADGGTGKTGILEFIKSGLTGDIDKEALNDETGIAKGSVEVELDGEMVTIQIFRSRKSKEQIKYFSTNKAKEGKNALKDLIGYVDVNPFELRKMDPDDQIKWFKKVLKIDSSEIEAKRMKIFSARTAINNRVKVLKNLIDAEGVDQLEEKKERLKEELPYGTLLTDRSAAIEKNKERALKVRDIEDMEKRSQTVAIEIETLQEEIDRLTKIKSEKVQLSKTMYVDIQKGLKWIKATPVIEIEVLNEKVEAVNRHNLERAQFQGFLEKYNEYQSGLVEAQKMTAEIQTYEKQREDYIKSKVNKVPGLELREPVKDEEGNVTDPRVGGYFKGKPANMLSTTEAVQLAMILKKTVNDKGFPIMILDDYESVGSQGRQELAKLCTEEGWSALVAHVDPNQKELKFVLTNDPNFKLAEPPKTDYDAIKELPDIKNAAADKKAAPAKKAVPKKKAAPAK